MQNWGWRLDVKSTNYAAATDFRLGFGYLPPRTKASVVVENLQALAEIPATLESPIFHVAGGTLAVQGSLASDQYLQYQGGDSATVYDANWQKIKDLPAARQNFIAPKGDVKISVTTAQTTPPPWLETQFLTEGVPIVLPVP